jgi:ABC-type multidrug transport system fused ATPase/permease subunit
MRDYPPLVTAWTERSTGSGDPTVPDTRSAGRLLWWFVRHQGLIFVACSVLSLTWVLPAATAPWVLGRAVDEGIVPGDSGRLAFWVLVLLAVTVIGASSGVVYHTTVVRSWLVALYTTTLLVTHKSVALGHILPRRVPTGEVLSVADTDGNQFGGLLEVLTRVIGELVALAVIAVIVLRINLELGLVILLVAPLLVLTSGPLLRPMGNAQTRERTRDSELTGRATDIVAGLRILRGIGGERTFGDNYARQSQRVREAGVRAGAWQALVDAIGVLMSGMFVVALMWLGIGEVRAGRLQIGELITFLGYALFLLQPIQTFFFLLQKGTRAVVSARKTASVLGQSTPWPDRGRAARLDPAQPLTDEASGLVVRPGLLTMVVSADPDAVAALADRLGRYLPRESDPLAMDGDEDARGRSAALARRRAEESRKVLQARDAVRAAQRWGVSLGGVDLAEAELDDVRRTILVSDTGSFVFAGTLQDAIDPHGRCTREMAEEALRAAAAEDVYDITPGGWQGVIDERGRGLSGGQRQRLVLARALAQDPPILVLVEPTSAVDAHTEARVAERLRRHRIGRTTVIMSASPLLLHHADEVAFLDGVVVESGTHDDLLARSAAYRDVVLRGAHEAVAP